MIKLELNDMELISDNFEKNRDVNNINNKFKNSITKTFKLGIANGNDITKLVFNYCMFLEQKDENENSISKSNIEYMFLFDDMKDEVISKLKEGNADETYMENLVMYLDNITYPYIKEYIENKYKRANIEIKLPFEFRENN